MGGVLSHFCNDINKVMSNHPWASTVCKNNQAMACYSEAIQDDYTLMVLKETNTNMYHNLGHGVHILSGTTKPVCVTLETSSKAKLHKLIEQKREV